MYENYEWDEDKDRINVEKHCISFQEAIEIFQYPYLTKIDARKDYGEKRIISIGIIDQEVVVVLVVVHTKRETKTRIISARKANSKERKLYHEYIEKKTN